MSVRGKTSQGSTLSVGVVTGGTTAWTVCGGIKNISQSGYQTSVDDATQLSSTYQEWVPTLISPGEITITTIRDSTDAGQALLNTAFTSLSILPFKIQVALCGGQVSQGDQILFSALVLEAPVVLDAAKIQMVNYKLKLSGTITVTEGS